MKRKFKFDYLGIVPEGKRGHSSSIVMMGRDGTESVQRMMGVQRAGEYGVIVEGNTGDTVHIQMVPLYYDQYGQVVKADPINVDLMPLVFEKPLEKPKGAK